jgi:hypothetical protein
VKSARSTGGNWLERYEALRAHAVGERGLGFTPLGLAVLRHRGLVAWMAIESRALEPTPSWTPPARENESLRLEPGGTRAEFVQLLAGTALLAAAGGGS